MVGYTSNDWASTGNLRETYGRLGELFGNALGNLRLISASSLPLAWAGYRKRLGGDWVEIGKVWVRGNAIATLNHLIT